MKARKDVNVMRQQCSAKQRWIYGRHTVARRLQVNPATVRELNLSAHSAEKLPDLRELAAGAGIPVTEVDEATLRRRTGTTKHQGVAALAAALPYRSLEKILSTNPPAILVVDGIQDPQNLGAVIRTAAAAGMAGIVVPRHGQVGVTPAVEKAAAGAANDVPLCSVTNLRRTLENLRGRGFWVVALDPCAEKRLFNLEMPIPVALVLGGEQGLRPLVRETCDLRVSIPMRPGVESLNASVAAAVAMYELVRTSLTWWRPSGTS